MVNDPVGDFLTRVRNSITRKKRIVEAPSSKMLVSISQILKNENFIESFDVIKNDVQDVIRLNLRYVDGESAIRELKRISKPGVRKYFGYRDIASVMSGMGISIFSTPKGVISGKEARDAKVGGEYICQVY